MFFCKEKAKRWDTSDSLQQKHLFISFQVMIWFMFCQIFITTIPFPIELETLICIMYKLYVNASQQYDVIYEKIFLQMDPLYLWQFEAAEPKI